MTKGPDFLGIGAQRAGTSWIYACIQEHPELCMPEKEINFFSREQNWANGYEWYEKQFNNCSNQELIGEYSTSYLSHKQTPKRIREEYPEIKLIVSLRNPYERAYSSFRNDIVSGDIDKSIPFEEALNQRNKYIRWGCYYSHLKKYLNYFDREQIQILIYEDSKKNPKKFIKNIFEFLNVNISFEPTMLQETINQGYTPKYPIVDKIWNTLADTMRKSKMSRPVWWFGKKLRMGRFVRNLNSTTKESQQSISMRAQEILQRSLEEEIIQLKDQFGLTVDHWTIEESNFS